MKKILLLCITMLLLFVSAGVQAQKVTVNAKLDSTVIMIGDQAHLSFEISQQPNQKVMMPLFTDSIAGLEVVEPVKIDTVKTADGKIQITHNYVVTAFDDSLMYIPPYPFVANGDTFWTKSLSLKVVQPFKIDTASQTIADIKPVMEPGFDWNGFFKLILLILVIAALLFVGFVVVRKYIQKKPLFESKTSEVILPPHVIALNQLDRIKQEKLWQSGRYKEYHTELTDVIREYIERMFGFNSMEMTSEEILDQLRGLRIEQRAAYDCLQQILNLADLVKFAKWHATPDEHELSLMNAYLFVNQTLVEEVKPLEDSKKEENNENNQN